MVSRMVVTALYNQDLKLQGYPQNFKMTLWFALICNNQISHHTDARTWFPNGTRLDKMVSNQDTFAGMDRLGTKWLKMWQKSGSIWSDLLYILWEFFYLNFKTVKDESAQAGSIEWLIT